jgi:hypothetical protein
MNRSTAFLALLLAAGCAAPLYDFSHNIGVVKNPLLDEAIGILEREGIRVEKGENTGTVTGIRVAHESAYSATRYLMEWRRGKPPGSFFSREEFLKGLEGD